MTERQAWFCPACRKHHAPHCDSCPNPTAAQPVKQPCVDPHFGVPYSPWLDPDTNPAPYIGDPIYPIFTTTCGGMAVKADPNLICINGAH